MFSETSTIDLLGTCDGSETGMSSTFELTRGLDGSNG
jgi:hypothetical protein